MIVYTVEVRHYSSSDLAQCEGISNVCAYTTKDEAEKHIQAVQVDLFSETEYRWTALEVKDQFDPHQQADQ